MISWFSYKLQGIVESDSTTIKTDLTLTKS
jgi:hypothetical protein